MYIYFVLEHESLAVKIGKSCDPKRRLSSLSVGSPAQLSLICAIKVPKIYSADEWEAMCHERFKDENIRGEWFRLSPELHKFLKIMRKQRLDLFMKYFDIQEPAYWQ